MSEEKKGKEASDKKEKEKKKYSKPGLKKFERLYEMGMGS
jgi:hypothetical protein